MDGETQVEEPGESEGSELESVLRKTLYKQLTYLIPNTIKV